VLLAYAWAAYPFTLFTLSSNTNDSLVAALVTLSLLAISSPHGRGVLAALAGLTKFAPFALAPLLARGIGERPRGRALAGYVIAFAVTVLVCMLPVLLDDNLRAFWHDSVSYQSDRQTPFSVWGLWKLPRVLQHLLQGAVIALALVIAVVPRRRGVMQVAALGAAVIIALQLTVNYWLYPYIVWFYPLVIVALFASHPEPGEQLVAAWDELEERPAVTPAPPAATPAWSRPPADPAAG
jgi:hypothetical protein